MSVNISLVILSIIKLILSSSCFDGVLFSMATPKSFLKYFSENWYIGSISAKSVITKYRTVPLMAMGMYELREMLICYSMAVVYYSFFLIMAEFFLLSYKVLISSTLSKIIPVLYDNSVRMLS
jgi:hypothetical protein